MKYKHVNIQKNIKTNCNVFEYCDITSMTS